MATKITADQLKRAIALKLKAKDADGIKKELIKKLAENDVEGVDNETIDELMDMYEAFVNTKEAEVEEEAEEEEEESTEESEVEELAEEEEEEEAPAKKPAAKPAPAKATAPVAKKPAAAPAPAAKTAAAPAKKAPAAPVVKYSAWSGEEKGSKKQLQPIIDLFPEAEVKWLKQGITLFYPGKSSKKAIISFDRVKVAEDGTVVGDLFFNALKGKDAVVEHVGEDREYKCFNTNLWFLSKMEVAEAVELLSETEGLIDHMNKTLADADKRAVKNREKLEESMANGKQTAAKPVAAKPAAKKAAAAVEEEEAEEEEAEEEVPVKKAPAKAATPVAKAPVKKAAPVVEEEEAEEEEEEVPVKKAPVKTVAKKK